MAQSDHRIRLRDDDLELIVASLRARLAMMGARRREHAMRLIGRLEDAAPGNPFWRLSGTEGYDAEAE